MVRRYDALMGGQAICQFQGTPVDVHDLKGCNDIYNYHVTIWHRIMSIMVMSNDTIEFLRLR